MGEGFLELPVDAEPFQGGGLAAQVGLGEIDGADGPVPFALIWLISRCGFAVHGHRVFR